MMISPDAYVKQFSKASLERCLAEREELLKQIRAFEADPSYKSDIAPSALTQYLVNIDYLKELLDLIAIKIKEADPDYVPDILSTIEIRKAGICDTQAEAVVNAANAALQMGGGVCGAIFKAAGAVKLQQACDKIGHCPTGKAVITPGFELCDHIIHAVGPIYNGGNADEAKLLYSSYISSLELARDNGISSIAFPLISSGIYGYPKDGAWRQALKACDDWIRQNHDYQLEIIFTIIDDETLQLGKKIAAELNIGVR